MSIGESPWLSIPLADYEGHMEAVGQTGALRRLFADVYATVKPARLAVLGCTTGADFDGIDPGVTRLALGVDINARYLAAAEQRANTRGVNAQFICADVLCVELSQAPFDLIHAALLLEYVDTTALFRQVRQWLSREGVFSVVSQEPVSGVEAVSATEYESVQILAGQMNLQPAVEIERIAVEEGFALKSRRSLKVPRGKVFTHLLFEAGVAAPPASVQAAW
jgi:SAM-dependent methyltransferase